MNNFNGYTLFVDGLPNTMNSKWLKNVFKSNGEIVDVYVSFKNRSSSKNLFDFVRFKHKNDAEKAISCLDDTPILSSSLKISWAWYKRDYNANNNYTTQNN